MKNSNELELMVQFLESEETSYVHGSHEQTQEYLGNKPVTVIFLSFKLAL